MRACLAVAVSPGLSIDTSRDAAKPALRAGVAGVGGASSPGPGTAAGAGQGRDLIAAGSPIASPASALSPPPSLPPPSPLPLPSVALSAPPLPPAAAARPSPRPAGPPARPASGRAWSARAAPRQALAPADGRRLRGASQPRAQPAECAGSVRGAEGRRPWRTGRARGRGMPLRPGVTKPGVAGALRRAASLGLGQLWKDDTVWSLARLCPC